MLTVTPPEVSDLGAVQSPPMQPVSFDQCFGWLHARPDGAGAEIAVILCPGLRTDGLTAYRSFRLLATALAGAGYPTLRFDYPGTGDSRDLDAAEHWSAWQHSIHTAIDWLRDRSGARRIVLCGLRLGATLAASVCEQRDDVVGLILLAPVLRGKTYIRQLATEASVRGQSGAVQDGLVVHELQLSAATVRLLNQIDLRKITPPRGSRVMVYAPSESPILTECAATWAAGDVEVSCEDFAGLEPMLQPSFMSHEASANVARIVAWLSGSFSAVGLRHYETRRVERAEIRLGHCTETPLRFGTDDQLFGVLCRPTKPAQADLAIVIVNSSGDPHQGPARVTVDIARQLAANGFASLRMDFAGLGDSVAPHDAETHVFETNRQRDIAAAIDALEDLGYRRFAAQGLCSGAYHAFHAGCADSRIGALLLINLPLFQWRKGDAIEFMNQALQSPVGLLPKLKRMDLWQRLLQQGLLGLRTRLAMQGAWLLRTVKATAHRAAKQLGLQAPLTFAQDSIRILSQRTRTLFLFAEGDVGIALLANEIDVDQPPPNVEVRVPAGLDHALTRPEMRHIVVDEMTAFLTRD